MWTIELCVMLVLIGINSLLAAYEIALASVSLARLDTLARERKRGVTAALRMKGKMEASLATIQLGITVVGALAAAIGGAGAGELLVPMLKDAGYSAIVAHVAAILAVVLPLTVVTILFGELIPKVFALRHKELVTLQLSPPMLWMSRSVWPVVWLLERAVITILSFGEKRLKAAAPPLGSSDAAALQELRASAALARTSMLIGFREEGIIVNAARLASTPVRNIMLPANHIAMLAADAPLAESLISAHHDMHTRFPVTAVAGDPQEIVGYVNFKDIVACLRLTQDASLRSVLRPIPSLPAEMSVAGCLERLIPGHHHIAIVRDETNHVLGMLTLEDVLEELVGEIEDEYDRLPTDILPSGNAWVVGGGVGLPQLQRATGIELPTADLPASANLADWVDARLRRPVRGGEIVSEGDVRILVRKVRRHRLLEAQVSHERPQQG